MTLGQTLERLQRRRHLKVIGIGFWVFGQLTDNEGTDAATVKLGNIAMAIILLRTYGEEEGCLGEDEGAAVGQQPVDMSVGISCTVSADEGGDERDGIGHNSILYLVRSALKCS